MGASCSLTYHVLGVANADATTTQFDVREEVQEALGFAGNVSATPITGGLELSISVADITPFNQDDFEPYIYEHVVWHAINACCQTDGDRFEFKLVSSEFN